MRILVTGTGSVALRAAASLAAHPDVAGVGLADTNPPTGWSGRMVHAGNSRGYDVVVGRPHRRLPSVTSDDAGTVGQASPLGLARSLAATIGPGAVAAMTVAGKARRSPAYFDFPRPVGRVLGRRGEHGVLICPTDGDLAAAGAALGDLTVAVVDETLFLQGVCLAAGALLGPHRGPVWETAETYIAACEDLGLVRAESP